MADYGERKVDWEKIDKHVVKKKPEPRVGKDGIKRNFPGQSRSSAGRDRRNEFLEELEKQDGSVSRALQRCDWSKPAYEKMRQRWPEFAARVDGIRGIEAGGFEFTGEFAEFRKEFFGFDTPWFHRLIVQQLQDNPGGGGSITMILLPPEHGKTTLLEDWNCFSLAMDPNMAITVGSERQEMARKVLRRVRHRMEVEGPTPEFVARFGPFSPMKAKGGAYRGHQPWGADYFDVYKKRDHDEREYSMQALGITSQIAGSRTHLLQADDITSLKNYNQTEKLVETFRQDWLSRPGTTGRTVILGTRVGEMDFYESLEVEGLVDSLIKLPAINDEGDYLWPDRYSVRDYERMRRNVGEDAWWRNYMQKPRAVGDATFTEEAIEKACRPWLTLETVVQPEWPIYIGIDPALGGVCAISAFQHCGNELRFVGGRYMRSLSRAEQIMQELEALVLMFRDVERQVKVTDVIIETNAFQKGLAHDERLVELSDRHGFSIMPHVTGKNKHDELIGLAQMERSMRQNQIVFPYGSDDRTRALVDPMLQEMRTWRPDKRGNRLRQDRLMSMWFVWILWRNRLGHRFDSNQEQFKVEAPTSYLLGPNYRPIGGSYNPIGS